MSRRAARILQMTSPTFTVRSVQAFCYRYPLSTPVVTSFGKMLNRPAVFVRVEDDDGVVGWGEVWSNFPSTGAEHRARLVNEVLAPAITGFSASEPARDLRKAHARHLGAGTAIRRTGSVRAGDRRDRSCRVGSLCAAPQDGVVETARRRRRTGSRSMPAASIRPARGRWRKLH